MSIYRTAGKRAFDVTLAAAALVALSPVLLVVALAVRLGMGRPVLFRQLRPGRGGRPFELLKFRTMRDARDAEGRPLPDAERQVLREVVEVIAQPKLARQLSNPRGDLCRRQMKQLPHRPRSGPGVEAP